RFESDIHSIETRFRPNRDLELAIAAVTRGWNALDLRGDFVGTGSRHNDVVGAIGMNAVHRPSPWPRKAGHRMHRDGAHGTHLPR
ncbi:MAG: hypothetical protein OEV43_05665, partial [Coriobacteriia bacterium]|nr:hypothetical protein [Coriobacteriia bacterium]